MNGFKLFFFMLYIFFLMFAWFRSKESSSDKSEEEQKKFMFHSWLKDKEQEMKCLREISDALLFLLLSRSYGHCAPIRYLLREIVAGSGRVAQNILSASFRWCVFMMGVLWNTRLQTPRSQVCWECLYKLTESTQL